MNLEDLWGQIEADYSWRVDEIRFLENQLGSIINADTRQRMRRPIVLIMYAHFEGFCKFCFTLYVDTINKSAIHCSQANSAIAAASLSTLFKQLRNPDSKSIHFKSLLPEDNKLHTFAREKDFIEASYALLASLVAIPETYVDMESNLKPIVLRKLLFQLGFKYDLFKDKEGSITILLKFRNGIGHGDNKEGITTMEYELIKRAAINVMSGIKQLIMEALRTKAFLKEDDGGFEIFECMTNNYC